MVGARQVVFAIPENKNNHKETKTDGCPEDDDKGETTWRKKTSSC
jgi:hypothetical protein